jgi:competence protein ComEA
MMRWVSLAISAACAAALIVAAPQSDLPAGKGKEVLERMCVNCHGLEQITSQRYSKKFWGSVVDDMVSRGAEGSEDDVNAIISYLSRNFGQPVKINTATAKEIEAGLSFTPAESEAVVKYRTDKGDFKSFEELQKVPGLRADLLDEQKKNIAFQ